MRLQRKHCISTPSSSLPWCNPSNPRNGGVHDAVKNSNPIPHPHTPKNKNSTKNVESCTSILSDPIPRLVWSSSGLVPLGLSKQFCSLNSARSETCDHRTVRRVSVLSGFPPNIIADCKSSGLGSIKFNGTKTGRLACASDISEDFQKNTTSNSKFWSDVLYCCLTFRIQFSPTMAALRQCKSGEKGNQAMNH